MKFKLVRLEFILVLLTSIVEGRITKTTTTEFQLSNDEYINIRCNRVRFEKSKLLTYNQTLQVKTVRFIDCYAPPLSYAAILQDININLIGLKRLEVIMTPVQFQLTGTHFENLTIQELSIEMLTVNKKRMKHIDISDILKPLENLTVLDIHGVKVPPFPFTRLQIVSLCYGLSLGDWGECKNLKELRLNQWDWAQNQIPEHWLSNCSEISSITIHDIDRDLTYQFRNVIDNVRSLKNLAVSVYSFEDQLLKDLFVNANNLGIQSLKLTEWRREYKHRISLRNIEIDSLEYLYFETNNIIDIQGLPITRAPKLTVDFTSTTIREVGFEKSDYEMLTIRNVSAILRVDDLTLECGDCQFGWLSRAVRDRRLNFSVWKINCTDGRDLLQVIQDTLECDRPECEDCECTRRWRDNTTVARCIGNATRIPQVWGLVTLLAPGNRIETINSDDIPKTLLNLDLRDNRITSMDAAATAELFSNKDRRVRLSGNPLVCSCENQPLLEALQTYQTQVEDFNTISCAGEGPLIRDLFTSNLCHEQKQLKKHMVNSIILAVCGILLGLLAIAAALYCRFKRELKVYLFAHGFCLQFLHEEELDADRIYDAFISYCHTDEEFIVENLLPKLDTEYKLCLHFRDWIVGDFIPAQITRSVEQSRRTIIILSRSFAESLWGLLEFRTAHTCALNEGRARLIIIVIDDVVNDDKLDSELRSYVRNYTYVRWGDRMFWEKLRYAMPHQKQTRDSHRQMLTENVSEAVKNSGMELVGLLPKKTLNK